MPSNSKYLGPSITWLLYLLIQLKLSLLNMNLTLLLLPYFYVSFNIALPILTIGIS